MDKQPAPPLLPILRSRQQADLLDLLLGNPELELSLTDIAGRTGVPYASVHREVERAEAAGIFTSRKIGQTRLVRADVKSPYFDSLAELLTRAFGPPRVLAEALAGIDGIERAFVHGSWAAQTVEGPGSRPVADIDLLILGAPDRDLVFATLDGVERRLGRPVQVSFRAADWLEAGSGAFHATLTDRPIAEVPLLRGRTPEEGSPG
ncbi:MAG: ArsR family transcriptional regulator [Actinobacteria bacterium]|nr:ArsR family transcriptional regulator [Actinomycetota bacterium]